MYKRASARARVFYTRRPRIYEAGGSPFIRQTRGPRSERTRAPVNVINVFTAEALDIRARFFTDPRTGFLRYNNGVVRFPRPRNRALCRTAQRGATFR